MKRVLRILRASLLILLVMAGVLGALFGYFVYSPAPEVPRLSGTLTRKTIRPASISSSPQVMRGSAR
jgi:polyhydroxybutyrate depolymerase